jgi:hypothetical protein
VLTSLLQDPDDKDQQTVPSDLTQMVASVPLSEDAQKLSEHKIQEKLSEELGVLLKQQGMNPLIRMAGMIWSVLVGFHISQFLQALTCIRIPQLKSSTQFSLVL